MKTTIEWTHRRLPDGTLIPGYTFNIAWGCFKVSEECKFWDIRKSRGNLYKIFTN